LFNKFKAWREAMRGNKTPPPKDNKVDEAVDLILNMASLLHIDPQKIVGALQQRLEDNEMKTNVDSDIEAIVNHDMLGGGFRV
jgi:hypothetical protein